MQAALWAGMLHLLSAYLSALTNYDELGKVYKSLAGFSKYKNVLNLVLLS